VAEDLFERGLCLPSVTAITEEALDRVVERIRKIGAGRKAQGAGRKEHRGKRREKRGKRREDRTSINFPIESQTLFHYT
jgi:hypothetical protein